MQSGNGSILLSGAIAVALGACGGGGGSAPPATPPQSPPQQNEGSLAIADVDTDDDGLIEIATLEQLDWVRNDARGGSLTDHNGRVNSRGCAPGGCKGYELAADLDFDTNRDGLRDSTDSYFDYEKDGSSAGWLPIAAFGEPFNAVFEGNNHHISNLYINRPEAAAVGLFGIVTSHTGSPVSIRNVVIDGTLTSITGKDAVGALIGEVVVSTPTIIESNKVTGTVIGTGFLSGGMIGRIGIGNAPLTLQNNESSVSVQGTVHAGSLVGMIDVFGENAQGTTLAGNSASGAVFAGEIAGGLAGIVVGSNAIVMENCSASGKVSSQSTAGGLVGSAWSVRISRSHASGDILNGSSAGGLIGSVGADVTVEESWSTSSVISVTAGSLGGLIGSVFLDNGFLTIHSSFSEGSVVSQEGDVAGGLVGHVVGFANARFSLSSSYSTGDISAHDVVGGIAGLIRVEQNAEVVIENVFALGKVSARQALAGGLIGDATSGDTSSIRISNAYSVNAIVGDFLVGGLVGNTFTEQAATITVENSYWATDTTGQSRSSGVIPPAGVGMFGVHGATLAELSCPTGANDFTCGPNELYHGWEDALNANGEPAWRFSNPGQLPALRFAGVVHQPTYSVNRGFSVLRE